MTSTTDSVAEYYDGFQHLVENKLGEIRTFTGKLVYPMNLKPGDICIEDIAHGLSRVCRFAGHCAGFMSVAEHSVAVARIVMTTDPDHALEALLHDGSEAYLGDLPRPIKHLPEMAPYREAEARAEAAIAEKFGLVHPLPQSVKDADRQRLFIEFESFRDNPAKAMPPDVSKGGFIAVYHQLIAARKLSSKRA
jgi:hypothetical protein